MQKWGNSVKLIFFFLEMENDVKSRRENKLDKPSKNVLFRGT